MNISNWIEKHADFTPEKPAIRFVKDSNAVSAGISAAIQVWSYSQFENRIRRIRFGLQQNFKVKAGDRVAFLGYNNPDMLALLFACAGLGAVLVPLNWRLAAAEHAYILQDSAATLLVCEADFRENAERARTQNPACKLIAYDFSAEGWSGFDDLLTDSTACEKNLEISQEAPILIIYTSGTTGRPKGAVLTQNALFWNALNSIHLHDLTSEDHVLSVLPLFHVGPLNIQTVPAFYVGSTITLTAKFDAAQTLDLIETERPSLILLVPVTMQAILQHPNWKQTNCSSLRTVTTGSSVVPIDLLEGFHQRNIPVGQVYGSTETCPIAAYLCAEDAISKIGSTGKAALHCELRVVDENGRNVTVGESGELQVRGPNVMSQYWNNPAETEKVFVNDWYSTGDVGYFDEDGFLFINDRKRDIIISGSENIYPAEIEAVLREHEAIFDVAVVGKTDPEWGEVPVAYVVIIPESELSESDILLYLSKSIARFKQPKAVFFLDALPRNTMGKVLKYELREIAEANKSSN
ncbi:MAG: long-chain fatty acid--CoA ligase [SAR324 cluster bacterium]|nr:long-chain fatty acid--CoA ligase [SAR324 cluster bacterium]